MCEEASACVACISCGVVYGVAGWCLLGVPGSLCSGVRGPCSGLQVGILFSRCPVCGLTCAWVRAVV